MDADDAKRLISRETGFPIFSASERGGYASGNLFIEAISMGLKRNRHDGAIKVSDLEKSIKKEMPIIVDDYNRKLKAFCIKQKNADCYEKNKAEMTPVIFPGASDFEITGSAKGKQR
jgi:hypothetical protein